MEDKLLATTSCRVARIVASDMSQRATPENSPQCEIPGTRQNDKARFGARAGAEDSVPASFPGDPMPVIHSIVARAFLASARVVRPGAANVKLETESYTIPSGDPGIDLYIRHKHPAGVETFTPDKILLYVHGATYPSETAFDLPIDGVSMMDLIASRGYDVYLVDIRGYGGSTRPPEMNLPAAENKPIVHTDVAVHDFGVAVDQILSRSKDSKHYVMALS